jgi:hypothetical protein
MQVPKAFQKLAASRGSGLDGAVPKTRKLFLLLEDIRTGKFIKNFGLKI